MKYCTGTGDTIEQAIEDAKIAKSEWIKEAYENNTSVPEPSDQEKEEEYNGRISLRIPRSLHKMVVELAKPEGVSANQFILFHLSMGVGKKNV